MRKFLFVTIIILMTQCLGKSKAKLKLVLPLGGEAIEISRTSEFTNEFGNKTTFSLKMKSEPESLVYICLASSNTVTGGTILVSGFVISGAGICSSSPTYLEFNSTNWNTDQSFQVVGSRGTVGVSGNTNYSIQFLTISADASYNNYPLAEISLTNLDIDVVGSYFVRTNVSGLTASIQLENNSSEILTITENGYNNFPTTITNGLAYSVSIKTQAVGQVCSISNLPYGTSSVNVEITIICVSGFLFNGTLLSSSNPPTLNQSFAGLVTLAGSFPTTVASGNTNGTGTTARFDNPIAITSDGTNIYVADIFNNAIRKVVIGTNAVSTLATITNLPHGVATDGVNVYVAAYGNHTIQKVDIATGNVTTLAGSPPSGDIVGASTVAKFYQPTYLTTDGTNLFVTDRGNQKIKKIVISTGIVSIVVTSLVQPNGIATDGTNLYIADTGDHRIIKYVIAAMTQSIVAGTGVSGNSDNLVGISALLNSPYGITMDGSYLYILEGTGKNLRKMLLSGTNSVTTIMSQNNGYEDGIIGVAKFCNTGANCDSSITFDGSFLYIADRYNHAIRRLYY